MICRFGPSLESRFYEDREWWLQNVVGLTEQVHNGLAKYRATYSSMEEALRAASRWKSHSATWLCLL